MVLKQLENNMGRAYVHILSLACTVVVILHLFACLFHYVTLWDESNTWVESSGDHPHLFACSYQQAFPGSHFAFSCLVSCSFFLDTKKPLVAQLMECAGIVDTSSMVDRYLSSLYWAMSTMVRCHFCLHHVGCFGWVLLLVLASFGTCIGTFKSQESLCLQATVGYGDITPIQIPEKVLHILSHETLANFFLASVISQLHNSLVFERGAAQQQILL